MKTAGSEGDSKGSLCVTVKGVNGSYCPPTSAMSRRERPTVSYVDHNEGRCWTWNRLQEARGICSWSFAVFTTRTRCDSVATPVENLGLAKQLWMQSGVFLEPKWQTSGHHGRPPELGNGASLGREEPNDSHQDGRRCSKTHRLHV